MLYRKFGKTDLEISVVGLGGHEFHEDHRVAGFGDDSKLAVTAGYIFPGFGGENRLNIVTNALDAGINLFDATIDSEKEALGRILEKLNPREEIFVQTRPEGMVYTYDPFNARMADYSLLKEEAVRALKLLRRETIDIYNFAFMAEALEHDSDYLDKIEDNIKRLKAEGIIRFASADTFSGPGIYAKQIETGVFDSMFINMNPIDKKLFGDTVESAAGAGMAVLGRELFKKGRLFKIAEAHGYVDRGEVAKALLKWSLTESGLTSTVIGVDSPAQLRENLAVLADTAYTKVEERIIDCMKNESFDTTG